MTRPRRLLFPPLLRFALCGYFVFSKPFAYLHPPGAPLFIGEIVLAVGIFEAFRLPGTLRRVIASSTILQMVVALMAVCGLRLVTSLAARLGTPLEAVRDSAIWYYSAFAILVAFFAARDPGFVPALLGALRKAIPVFMLWVPIVLMLRGRTEFALPFTGIPITTVKAGDIGVNYGMAISYVILRLDRNTSRPWREGIPPLLLVAGLGGLAMAGTQNRAGFITGTLIVVVTIACAPRRRRRRVLARSLPLLLCAVVAVVMVDPKITTGRREVSVSQFVSNTRSIFGGGDQDQAGTTQFRVNLWGRVLADARSPAYLLEGQGFGPNIYARYNPREDADKKNPLRSPHNSHLTVLARAGFPALICWLILWSTFMVCWAGRMLASRRRSPRRDLITWTGASVGGILLNAIFDPSLEGPQAGIWLWSLTGVGAVYFKARRRNRPVTGWVPAAVSVSAPASE